MNSPRSAMYLQVAISIGFLIVEYVLSDNLSAATSKIFYNSLFEWGFLLNRSMPWYDAISWVSTCVPRSVIGAELLQHGRDRCFKISSRRSRGIRHRPPQLTLSMIQSNQGISRALCKLFHYTCRDVDDVMTDRRHNLKDAHVNSLNPIAKAFHDRLNFQGHNPDGESGVCDGECRW